ncbi:unnamed protein product [Auanema sp. JU1783]|nr:unnamed protein product [Auanema sp. JU1783]
MFLTFPHHFSLPVLPSSTNSTVSSINSEAPLPMNDQKAEKSRPLRCNELCAVCGDHSTGYHYEVPSCNGCKTFFRRTIISERTFKCHKNGNCMFTKDIRCACRSCRFKKCLEVGMNPRAIQTSRPGFSPKEASPLSSSSPEPMSKKRAYDINSLLDMQKASCSTSACSTSASPSSPEPKAQIIDKEQIQRINEIMNLEDRLDYLRKSNFTASRNLLDLLTKPCALDDITKYEPSPLHFVGNQDIDFDKEATYVIEYIKSFSWFREMSFGDKCALLCDRAPPLVTLRIAYKRSIRPHDYDDFYSSTLESVVSTMQRLDIDRKTFALLNIVMLLDCSSYVLSAQAKEVLTEERMKLLYCLRVNLFQKATSTAALLLADHLSLMWTILKVAAKFRSEIVKNVPVNSLTRQLFEVVHL